MPRSAAALALSLAALVTSAPFAFAPLPAAAADKLTLALDWFVNPDHGPIILAEELGYFEEAGLEVEVIAPADPSEPPKMVAAGRVDLAVRYQVQLHLQVGEGLPVAWVGTLVATPLNCLLTLADGPIQEIADLEGRKIGFSVAGVEEVLLGAILEEHGVALDAVELVNVNFALTPALMTEQVAAVIGAYRNFELNQMEIEGIAGRCFYIEEEGLPAHDELIYVANPEIGPEKKDAIRRFLEATEKAVQYIVNHPDESWEIFKGTAAELDDELNARAWPDTIPRFALRPAARDAGRYARFERFMHERGLVSEVKPVSALLLDLHE
ncbi:MAG: ABC transporter substrate-binding protein [Pseudomonadota bacterium]